MLSDKKKRAEFDTYGKTFAGGGPSAGGFGVLIFLTLLMAHLKGRSLISATYLANFSEPRPVHFRPEAEVAGGMYP